MVWLLERLSDASEDLIRVLVDEFIGLILFGSWARGEAKVDSDVDLFIVLRKAGGWPPAPAYLRLYPAM